MHVRYDCLRDNRPDDAMCVHSPEAVCIEKQYENTNILAPTTLRLADLQASESGMAFIQVCRGAAVISGRALSCVFTERVTD